jgi:fructose-bisphosphate aldolase class II/tagatose 1,6-diphosphate aldolase GatY/KbaY
VDLSNLKPHANERTGLGVALAEPNDRAILTHLGTINATEPGDLTQKLASAARHWHIASYFLLSRLRRAWPDWCRALRKAGVTVSIDTNWDPENRWEGVRDLLPHVDVFLPNEAEALAISGAPSVDEAGRKLAAICSLVVIKRGADGASAYQGERVWHAPVPKRGAGIEIVDSVGAGDCFDAGFLRAWQLGHNIEDSLGWGMRCAQASLSAAGGIEGQLQERIPAEPCGHEHDKGATMRFLDSLRAHRDSQRALLAANFYNAETLLAVLRAAKAADAEIILQTSPSTIEYLGGVPLTVAMARAAARQMGVRAWLHLDHAMDPALIDACIDAGYDSVMIDASESDFATNVKRTREVVTRAHAKGVAVEAELGYVPKLGQADVTEDGFTSPAEAARFVEATGVDLLAVAIGTAHGFYKKKPKLDYERLSAIRAAVEVPLVLHGGSGIEPEAWQEAVRRGIAKINFATEIKDTFSRAIKKTMASGTEIDLRKTFPPAMEAVTELVAGKIGVCQMMGASV